MIGLEAKAHAVVIDAGSTGSRVLAFTFKRDFFNGAGSHLKLEDELWHQVKPGLSSFAEDP
jgi:ectonucleoside triphosphate diphosphohydrolase 5/6